MRRLPTCTDDHVDHLDSDVEEEWGILRIPWQSWTTARAGQDS